MTLTVNGSDVTGTYLTAKASANCAKVDRPLKGFVNGDQIVFIVDFQECESMTAWSGQALTSGGSEELETQWHLTINSSDANEEDNGWATTLSGSDVFTKQ